MDFLEQGAGISLITYGEVYEGVLNSRDTQLSDQMFQRFLGWIQIVPLDEATMRQFAGIRSNLRKKGLLIRDPDLLIAATAIQHDLTLLTRNRNHFERIEELKLHRTENGSASES